MTADCFSLLNLEPAFNVNLQALESEYFRQQRLYHPDRFVGKPDSERRAALDCCVDINTAYKIVKNPLSRAQYFLHLQGIAVGTEHDNIKPAPELLEETLSWREKIVAAQDMKELENLKHELNAMHEHTIYLIAQSIEQKTWNLAAQETLRLGYIIKAGEAALAREIYIAKSVS